MPMQFQVFRPTRGRGVSLPVFGSREPSESDKEQRMLAAVTAGVAICDPRRAVSLARVDRERPEDVIAPVVNAAHLQILFDAVSEAAEDPDKAPDPTDAERAAASRLNISVAEVSAARQAAKANRQACTAGLDWVASIDAQRLGDIARLGSSENALDLIPTSEEQLDDLEDRVSALELRHAELAAEIQLLKQQHTAPKKKAVTRKKAVTKKVTARKSRAATKKAGTKKRRSTKKTTP